MKPLTQRRICAAKCAPTCNDCSDTCTSCVNNLILQNNGVCDCTGSLGYLGISG